MLLQVCNRSDWHCEVPQQTVHPVEKLFEHGAVVELSGGPGSGKSELLYNLAFAHLRRRRRVTFFDLDYHFDPFRLTQIIDRNGLVPRETLRYFTLYKCSSLETFLCTLAVIEDHLVVSRPALLVVDSISAFYWHDKFRLRDVSVRYADVAARLKDLAVRFDFKCVVGRRAGGGRSSTVELRTDGDGTRTATVAGVSRAFSVSKEGVQVS